MKKLWMSLAAGSMLLLAQDQAPSTPPALTTAPPPEHARHPLDTDVQAQQMARRLKLTADQQSQVAGILAAGRDQMSGLKNDTSLSPQDRKAKIHAVRGDGESQIRALLNDEQKQSFDRLLQKRRERQQERKG